ncbi:MAG: PEGA domain-containing protein, partial [Spirochaetia bacterium]
KTSYAESLIDRQAELALRALSAAVRQRDLLLFERNVTTDQRERADQTVTTARATLEGLELLDPSALELNSEKPLAFWSGRAAGRLLDAVPVNDELEPDPEGLAEIARGADLDLLIWGTVEEIQGYLKVDFYAYSPYGAEIDLADAGTVALPSDIGREAEIIAGEIAAVLLGRPWGSVHVETNLDAAAIFVDGDLAGYGQASARYLSLGEVEVEVTANGYRTERRTVAVTDRQTTAIVLEMEQLVNRVVRIESAPAGADVYVDSVWAGRTPLQLNVPDGQSVVRLRRDGYLESRFVLTGDGPDRVARVLLPGSLNWADEIRLKRGGFYRSLTWFVLSVPVTMILNGVYLSVQSAWPPPGVPVDVTPANLATFGQIGNIFYWASSGALLVNLGLLVNVGINLFEYIDVGEGAHNQ